MIYGGFWRRLGAGFLDVMSINAISRIFFWLYEFITPAHLIPSADGSEVDMILYFYIGFIPLVSAWFFYAFFQSSKFQATPGMMVFSMYIEDYDGRPISFWRASFRWVLTFLSLLTLGIGYFMIAFTPRKQAFHDYISQTLVIKGFSFSESHIDKIKYAGFWKRFGAGLIDALILNFIILALGAFIIFIGNAQMTWQNFIDLLKAENLRDIKILGGLITASLLFNWLYYAFFLSSKYQGTPGMKIISLKITDYLGKRISFWRASGRYVLSVLCGFFYGSNLMIAFTPRKQGLYDYISKTLVVQNQKK
ncbi:MAG: RDD family protein [Proteobacteria bacterium]|nr:RDD family protein [Pseudomonadota bacterium]